MRFNYEIAAAVLAFALPAAADNCAHGSQEIGGNWYCQGVKGIKYTNVGSSGTYQRITSMNKDGSCTSEPKSFSGPIAPLDEEVSIHIRGPAQLKQFAAYSPTTHSKRDVPHAHAHRHGHQHFHKRHAATEEEEKRAVGDTVTAVIDGQTVKWVNTYDGTPNSGSNPGTGSSSAPAAPPSPAPAAPAAQKQNPPSSPSTGSSSSSSGSGDYTRGSYYDSSSQTADNIAFLANLGGAGSGVFDMVFGNSLSYVSADGTSCAAESTILGDVTIPSDKEVIIFTGQECGANNGDCGYYRDGIPAYHGFDGADKIFLIEFSMPSEPSAVGANADTPALWMLNAQIPRTLQYGLSTCSCWAQGGCGEFDIAEVLSPGSNYAKSTFHMNVSGGDSDYIERPTSGTMKLAVIFDAATSSARIQVLDDSVSFDASLSQSVIDSWTSDDTEAPGLLSLFALS